MVAGLLGAQSQQVCSEGSSSQNSSEGSRSQKPEQLCSEGRFKEAEIAYTELLEKAETAAGEELALLYNNRGHARWILCTLPIVKGVTQILGRYMQVDFPGALEDLEHALSLNPLLAAAHYSWATVTYRLNNSAAALPAFLRAVQLEPDNEEFKEGLRSCQEN